MAPPTAPRAMRLSRVNSVHLPIVRARLRGFGAPGSPVASWRRAARVGGVCSVTTDQYAGRPAARPNRGRVERYIMAIYLCYGSDRTKREYVRSDTVRHRPAVRKGS